MDNFVWDGTEQGLYNFLIWWGTQEPFEHSDGCEQPDNVLDCCWGKTEYPPTAAVGGPPWSGAEPVPMYFHDLTTDTKTDMKPGDRVWYLGEGKFRLEQK